MTVDLVKVGSMQVKSEPSNIKREARLDFMASRGKGKSKQKRV